MMKFYKILLCAALVSLSGCEEMFYREVDFTIEGEEEMLIHPHRKEVLMS